MKTLKRISVLTVTSAAMLVSTLAMTTPAYAGTSAISGATVFSDSTVHAANQSASYHLRASGGPKQIAAGGQDTAG